MPELADRIDRRSRPISSARGRPGPAFLAELAAAGTEDPAEVDRRLAAHPPGRAAAQPGPAEALPAPSNVHPPHA